MQLQIYTAEVTTWCTRFGVTCSFPVLKPLQQTGHFGVIVSLRSKARLGVFIYSMKFKPKLERNDLLVTTSRCQLSDKMFDVCRWLVDSILPLLSMTLQRAFRLPDVMMFCSALPNKVFLVAQHWCK